MSKQTSIDWLVDQLFKQGYFDGNKPLSITNLDHLQHQAKEMERQQIIDAHNAGKNILPPNESGEQYYKEEYGK